jgi:hypothetical protein
MAQYCDSQVLERNWFYWLLSSRTPSLDVYRNLGLLWTRVIGHSRDGDGNVIKRHGKPLPDPSHPVRAHCIALASPVYFDTTDGVVRATNLPNPDDLTLLSDSPIHQFDQPLMQLCVVVPNLEELGYVKEVPTNISWHAVLEDVSKMCRGISMKFKPRTEDEQLELASEALAQVIKKIAEYKLVYTPGRAPVFNLLTTTIHRIMFSIMNRRKAQREGLGRILSDAEAGVLPTTHRSLRTQTAFH